MVIIVMGVSGSGKTTIGRLLAERLGLPFYDGDHFHPPENVEKMSSGRPLTDEDRKPWLEELARQISRWNHSGGAVLACSALKQSYRDILRSGAARDNSVHFVWLKGKKSLILDRMEVREGHYMPPGLLDSQFDALEEPQNAWAVSVDHPPEAIADKIYAGLKQQMKL